MENGDGSRKVSKESIAFRAGWEAGIKWMSRAQRDTVAEGESRGYSVAKAKFELAIKPEEVVSSGRH